ncbi:MAG: NfeD family protein [Bacteroidales bacterium]|nr:NfeD family protein [Bacteroidales bacterium]
MGLILILSVVGILLILAEILITPGTFFSGVCGLACLATACYFSYTEFGVVGLVVSVIITVALMVTLVVLSLRANTWKKLALNDNIDSKADSDPSAKGISVGMEGVSKTRLAPMGNVIINGITVEATSDKGQMIDAASPVRVTMVEDNKIYVTSI